MKTKVLIIVSKDKKSALQLSQTLTSCLQEQNIESNIFLYNRPSQDQSFQDGAILSQTGEQKLGEQITHLEKNSNYTHAISLGGDGTVLFAARLCAPLAIPIFPINFGRFGFIASIQPDEWQVALQDFIEGKSLIHKRMMLQAEIMRGDEEIARFEALNDIVISASSIARLVNIEVSFNEITFGLYAGGGVVVSTPTGSTGYSATFASPILDPTVSAFLLTPMSPFSLSNRPIVLPSSGKLTLQAKEMRHSNIAVTSDGKRLCTLKKSDIVCITESSNKVLLAECSPFNFYSALKNKLGWQGSPL